VTRRHQLEASLKALALSGMLETLEARLAQVHAGDLGHLEFLQVLCEDEIARREAAAIERRVRAARFEQSATIEDFDFSYNQKLPSARIRDLLSLRFVEAGESVILHGPVGVGKTHVAQALGHVACRRGYAVAFTKTSRLLADLAGGHADRSWEQRLRRWARPALLILDEIQTGMGRTGTMWAHQRPGVVPDIMTAAKGLGGGLPLGATLVSPRADCLEPGDHGSTFGGNPVACAAGLATFRVIERARLTARAATAGDQLAEGIMGLGSEGHPVGEVRGRGLLIGVALTGPLAQQLGAAALEEGLLINPIGDRTIRLAPPLVISDEEIEQALGSLRRSLERVAGDRQG